MALLEVQNVSKSYAIKRHIFKRKERVAVLHNISLSLQEGECLGIVGSSGSGKTTLSRVILGLDKPDEGKVMFNYTNMYDESAKKIYAVRKDMQAVFQDSYSSLNPLLTIEQIVAEPLYNFTSLTSMAIRTEVHRLLVRVGLTEEFGQKYPAQLSGGQQQRVSIARAIALNPKLIILDEATSSLDMIYQKQVLALLNKLKKQLNLSYIFISHDIKATLLMADKLIVMHEGEIVEAVKDNLSATNLQHPISKELVRAIAMPKVKITFDNYVNREVR